MLLFLARFFRTAREGGIFFFLNHIGETHLAKFAVHTYLLSVMDALKLVNTSTALLSLDPQL